VERRRECSCVLPARDRGQADSHSLAVEPLETELSRPDAARDAEPVENLGHEGEVRRLAPEAGRVVTGHEGPHQLDEALDRNPLDRDQPRSDEALVSDLVDDEEPVGEVVQGTG
jgi:hypothetical protein